MDELGQSTLKTFNTIDAKSWQTIFHEGALNFWRAIRTCKGKYDFSGYGLLELFVYSSDQNYRGGVIPATQLSTIYLQLAPDAQVAFKQGLCAAAQALEPPPSEDSAYVLGELVTVGKNLKITELLPIFAEHAQASKAWGDDQNSYHQLVQLAQSMSVRDTENALGLARAVMGPAEDRSPHFSKLHCQGSLRQVLTDERGAGGAVGLG